MTDTKIMRDIIEALLSDAGARRYLNGDPVTLYPDDLHSLIQAAWARKPAAQVAGVEPARPDVLEKLVYHANERDDMTIDDLLQTLSAARYTKVRQSSHRQLELQLLSLLATHPAPGPVSVQTWQEQMGKSGRRECASLAIELMQEEIDALRALAADTERT